MSYLYVFKSHVTKPSLDLQRVLPSRTPNRTHTFLVSQRWTPLTVYLHKQMTMITRINSISSSNTKPTMIPMNSPASTELVHVHQ